MTPGETVLVVGIALSVLGVVSLLFDAVQSDGEKWFVGYLVGLLLLLAGVGLMLLVTL